MNAWISVSAVAVGVALNPDGHADGDVRLSPRSSPLRADGFVRFCRLLDGTKHESPDVRAMIWAGMTTGMRFGELSALLWDDVDFTHNVIHVRRSQVGGVVGPTKTRSYRTVPLHPMAAAILVEHQGWLATRTVKPVDAGMIVPSSTGSYRHASMLTKPLARCAALAGIDKHVTAHTMRRTFNNLARMAAGEIVARAMTGHATSAMTEHYSHVSLDEKAKAVNAMLGLPVGVRPELASTPTTADA